MSIPSFSLAQVRVVATSKRYDTDVFGLEIVDLDQSQDMVQVLANMSSFMNYLEQFNQNPLPTKDAIDFQTVTNVFADLCVPPYLPPPCRPACRPQSCRT